MVGLSEGEKEFIRGGIAEDLRSDGRKRYSYRPINVETGVIPQVCVFVLLCLCYFSCYGGLCLLLW